MAETSLPAARHETRDVGFRPLALGLGLTLVGLLASMGVAMWLYPSTIVDHRLPTALPAFPAPHLQEHPAADMRTFLQQETARLNSTGWVDQAHGIVHIPIDDAMRRIAQQGIPDWPATGSSPAK